MADDAREPFSPQFEPGFFTEASDRGAPSRWKTGDKVRFKNGIAEKLGGWLAQTLTGAAHRGVGRRFHEWASLDGESWIAEGTNYKLYLISRGVRYDITPVRRNIALTDPFTTTNGSATVTVVDAGHSAEVGAAVRYTGASAVGGITIDGEYFIATVIDGDSYTITHSAPASSGATGGGAVVAEYDINGGTADQTVALGWGVCTWSESTWGTARSASCSGVMRKLRVWSLDNFGEDLIASPRGGGVYWWDRTTGPLSRAVLLENAPLTNQRVLISNSGDQIVCLGAYDSVSGSPDPMFIRTSDFDSLTDFTLTEENGVFEERLSTGSEIITGARTNSGILVFTNKAVYLAADDSSEIYRVRKLAEGNSAIGPNAVIEIDGTVYLFAPYKFMMFDGVYSEIPCDVWEYVFKDIDRDQKDKVYCWYNENFSEIWWHYPSLSQRYLYDEDDVQLFDEDGETPLLSETPAENDRYVIYNTALKCWYFGSMDRTAANPPGPAYDLPIATDSDGVFYTHETGVNDDLEAMASSIESHDLEIGNSKVAAHVSKAVPDMLRQVGTFILYLKGKKQPEKPDYVTKGPYTFSATTAEKGVRITARQVAINFQSTALGANWRLGTWKFYLQGDSER